MSMPFLAGRTTRFATLAALVLTLPSVAKAEGNLDAYLPKSGKIEGHVMQLGVAPEDQAIDRQFRVAVQNNMEWFKKYVTSQKANGPVPYDKRMGVTEAQYDKLQHMKADFRPGDPIEITFRPSLDATAAPQPLINLISDNHSRPNPDGQHQILLEPYGYRWFRPGGLDYLRHRSSF